MRAYTEQENLFDLEQAIDGMEPVELDLSCCEILFSKPVDNTGNSAIVNLPNQIINE